MGKFKKSMKKMLAFSLCLTMIAGVIGVQNTNVKAADKSTPWLLSTDRPAYASSVNGGDIATYATDGRLGTQWGAAANLADQWLDVDLGGKADISKVVIDWQNDAAYGVAYQVLVSNDEINWTKIYETTNGTGGDEKKVLREDGTVDYKYYEDVLSTDSADKKLSAANGRYVRVLINYSKSQSGSSDKTSGWGASIREIGIYGIGDDDCIEPVSDARNIALGKNVEVSSKSEPWWASAPLEGSNAVDDNYDTYWLSSTYDSVAQTCDQYMTVDLGANYTIGRAVIQWQTEYANIWDLQVSSDNKNWTTVYRQLQGNGEDEEIKLYAENVRYVKMKGILMGRGSGYSIREFKIYEYQSGDEKVQHTIGELPTKKVEKLGKGSYVVDDAGLLQPREPKYITKDIDTPIPSNDWWTSIVYTKYSDTMPALPMAYKYSATGLSMYYADGTYTRADNGGIGADSRYFDLTIGTSSITGDASAKLAGYGDWSVDVAFSDDDTAKMKSTLLKGSPYAYTTFTDPTSVELNVNNLVKFMDDNGNQIIVKDGVTTTIDHFAVESQNYSEAPGDGNKLQYHYYGVYMPEGSKVTKVGNKLKISLGSNQNYLVVGALPVEEPIKLLTTETVDNAASKNDSQAAEMLKYMYKYAYAYVTDTTVDYEYTENTATCTTNYTIQTNKVRTGSNFSSDTLICMLPNQWKYSSDSYVTAGMGGALIYTSCRGDLRIHEGTSFSYSQRFNGIIPQYTTPDESSSYNEEWMYKYLEQFTDSALKSYWVADPYWQGKKSHPIAMGILISEQLGEYETRDRLIDTLKKIMENWLSYDGDEDYPYYMYYHTSWGAVSGDGGDHGMAINLSDHHFLWAYFIFPAAVLASYDSQFKEDYGDMIELLIRDCMNPDKEDDMLPFMRNLDVYEGHSWAGGYGDNNSGNNQESASEATFSWAGLYLWGLVTGNKEYRDAGIWGYTSEVDAIEQYWFNMDEGTELDSHNWPDDYGTDIYGDENCDDLPYTGMVWGLGYTNGTYFSGNPCCIMGIHLLPVTPAITYMGYDRERAGQIWEQYEAIQAAYQKKVAAQGQSDPEGWHHILWPFLALSDAEEANDRWSEEYTSHINDNGDYVNGVLSTDEMFNSYWYIENMNAKGYIEEDIWATNYTSYQVFAKTENGNTKYTAQIWNPTDETITVQFANKDGNLGTAKVGAHTLVDVDPTKNEDTTDTVKYVEYENRDVTNVVPGVVQAEDYATNFGCEPTSNPEEGEYIGWIDDGDSLVYNLDVKEEADYVLDYRVQCTNQNVNSAIKLKTDNDSDYINTTYFDNSTTNWKNVVSTQTVHLKAGKYQMKLLMVDGQFQFNYVKIYKVGTKPPTAPTDDLTKADLSSYPEIDLSKAEVIDASSEANDNGKKTNIIDKDYNTRWESKAEDPQYITIDLKESQKIGGVKIYWEAAYAKNYRIEVSNDNQNWTTAFTQTNGKGGEGNGDSNRDNRLESISFNRAVEGRYVRIYCVERGTGYGDSIYEIRLFGEGEDQKEQPTTEAPTTQKPTTQAPTTQKPTTQAPTTQKSTTQAPTTQKPTTQKPTTEAPTTKKPTTEETTKKPSENTTTSTRQETTKAANNENYAGYVSSTVKSTKIVKMTAKKKALKVKWKKVKGIKGYQIQYSTNKKFKKSKKKSVKKASKTTLTIKKLKAKKKYYVRIRTYVVRNGVKKYSKWSKKKYKKTK